MNWRNDRIITKKIKPKSRGLSVADRGISARGTDIITHFLSNNVTAEVKAKKADVFLRTCSLW